jgi:hypothetical protein
VFTTIINALLAADLIALTLWGFYMADNPAPSKARWRVPLGMAVFAIYLTVVSSAGSLHAEKAAKADHDHEVSLQTQIQTQMQKTQDSLLLSQNAANEKLGFMTGQLTLIQNAKGLTAEQMKGLLKGAIPTPTASSPLTPSPANPSTGTGQSAPLPPPTGTQCHARAHINDIPNNGSFGESVIGATKERIFGIDCDGNGTAAAVVIRFLARSKLWQIIKHRQPPPL